LPKSSSTITVVSTDTISTSSKSFIASSTFVSKSWNKSTPSSVFKSTASAISLPAPVQVPNSEQGVIVVVVAPAVVIDN